MTQVSKIEGRADLERRGPSIVNTDKDGFLAYLARREKALQDENKIQSLQQQVDDLKALVNRLLEEKK